MASAAGGLAGELKRWLRAGWEIWVGQKGHSDFRGGSDREGGEPSEGDLAAELGPAARAGGCSASRILRAWIAGGQEVLPPTLGFGEPGSARLELPHSNQPKPACATLLPRSGNRSPAFGKQKNTIAIKRSSECDCFFGRG